MQKLTIDMFRQAAIIQNSVLITGGCGCHEKEMEHGNNGIGNGGDPPPPGLAKQPRQDFNDGHLSDGEERGAFPRCTS